MCLSERLLRLERHRLAQELIPLLASLERAAREGDSDKVERLVSRAKAILRTY